MTQEASDDAAIGKAQMVKGFRVDAEHKRRLSVYADAARHAADALVSIVAFETAVRQAGLGINSPLAPNKLMLPMAGGLTLTMYSEAKALADAVTEAQLGYLRI